MALVERVREYQGAYPCLLQGLYDEFLLPHSLRLVFDVWTVLDRLDDRGLERRKSVRQLEGYGGQY